ncbi:MAG: hypothetical protein ACRCSK_02815 [Fusobacteriaceae bacterium]
MKKVLLGLVALSAVAMSAGNNVYLKGGIDLLGKYGPINGYVETKDYNQDSADGVYKSNGIITSDNNDFDGSSGVGYFAELIYMRSLTDTFETGYGIGYHVNPTQSKMKVDYTSTKTSTSVETDSYTSEYTMPSYNSVPIFFSIKANFIKIWGVLPYVQGSFGYSINSISTEFSGKNLGDKTYNQGKTDEYNQVTTLSTGKITNGLYYSIGAGIEWNDFVLDMSYALTQASYTFTENKKNTYTSGRYNNLETKTKWNQDFGRYTLAVGYKFTF